MLKGIKRSAINNQQSTIPRRGFTLIELLLYTGLVAVFLTASVYFAWDVVLGNIKARAHQEVQENLRLAGHRMQVEIRSAEDIDVGGSDFGVDLAADPGTILSLTGAESPYPIQFRVDQGTLQVQREGGSWVPLTSSLVEVTELIFTDLSERDEPFYENIHFTLTIQHRNPSGRSEWEKEATIETSVQLR